MHVIYIINPPAYSTHTLNTATFYCVSCDHRVVLFRVGSTSVCRNTVQSLPNVDWKLERSHLPS